MGLAMQKTGVINMFYPYHQIKIFFTLLITMIAVSTYAKVHRIEGTQGFIHGEFDGVGLTGDGELRAGAKLRKRGTALAGPIIGLHRVKGEEFAVVASPASLVQYEKSTTGFYRNEDIVFVDSLVRNNALVVLSTEPALYIFKIGAAQAKTRVELNTKLDGAYALASGPSGGIYVGGEYESRGVIAKVSLTDSTVTQVASVDGETFSRIATGRGGENLVAASMRTGRLYRLQGTRELKAVYESPLDEVTALEVLEDASVLVASVDSSIELTQAHPIAASVSKTPKKRRKRRKAIEGSQLVRIHHSGQVDILWQGKGHGVYDMASTKSHVYLATGSGGILYRVRIAEAAAPEIIAQTEWLDELTVLSLRQGALRVARAASAEVFEAQIGEKANAGEYRSGVIDAGHSARFGYLSWGGKNLRGNIEVSARSGWTRMPNKTWSPWSSPIQDAQSIDDRVQSGRFVQIRVGLKHPDASLNWLRLTSKAMNRKPIITRVNILKNGWRIERNFQAPELGRTLSLSADAFGEHEGQRKGSDGLSVKQFYAPGYQSVHAVASDMDGDSLRYRFQLGRVGEGDTIAWREGRDWGEEPYWSFQSNALASGTYAVLVEVDDANSRGFSERLTHRKRSIHFEITHSEPVMGVVRAHRHRDGVEIRFDAKSTSPFVGALCRAEGFGEIPMAAEDGIVDEPEEIFKDIVPTLNAASIVCEAYDEEGRSVKGEARVR